MGLSPYPCPADLGAREIFCWVMIEILDAIYNLIIMLISPLKLLRFRPRTPPAVVELDEFSTGKYERSKVLVKKLKRRNPAVQYKKLNKKQGPQCTICLEGVDKNAPVHPLPCEHIFHASCLHKYVWNSYDTCPLCRTVLVLPKQHGRRRMPSPMPFGL